MREASANVVLNAAVTLDRVDLPLVVLITVSDDGKGLNSNHHSDDRIGLIAKQERVAVAGGSIEIKSASATDRALQFSSKVGSDFLSPSGGRSEHDHHDLEAR